MHEVDETTEQMVRSVLAYREPAANEPGAPRQGAGCPPTSCTNALTGLICEAPRQPDEVLGVYTSVIAPSVISADSPRFLGFIPAAPTKASLLFDMLVSCASIQGISWPSDPGQRRLDYAVVDGGDVIGRPASDGWAGIAYLYSPRVWAFRLIRISNASETCHSRDSMTGVPSRS